MTVIIDTSILVAHLHSRDPLHGPTQELMGRLFAGELGQLVAPDAVLAEGLTLLRRRPAREALSRKFVDLFFGVGDREAPVRLVPTTPEALERAVQLQFQHYDRGLSIADCVMIDLAASMDATIASLDRGLDGLARRLSPAG